MNAPTNTPGYTYGTDAVPRSPVTPEQFEQMKKSALFDDDDVKYLRMSRDVLSDQVEAILDVWYGFIGSLPHLLASFTDQTSDKPIDAYLGAVRKRFAHWIIDTARAEYDQDWLDYQHAIALRHHRVGKNRTDNAAASAIVPFRDLFLLIFPVTHTLKPFLAKKGAAAEDVEKMHAAWVKSCLLQITLWSYPYIKDGDF
jgi:hypothetical protein